VRHQVLGQRRQAADAQVAAQAAGIVLHLARRLFHHDRHLARAPHQHLAGGGQAHAAPVLLEQFRAQVFLEAVDALGQRRLGAVQALGGASQVAFGGNDFEIFQVAEVHRYIPESLRIMKIK
jgi:hypothetical protein